jgi:hypothetical protein
MAHYAVKICKATNLAPKGINGTADAYVKLKLGRQEKRKTKIIRNNLNPIFDEWFDYTVWRPTETLVVSVWNANSVRNNEFLGQLQFDYPNDPTGHIKARLPLRSDESGAQVSGMLELEIVDIDVKRAYEKQLGAGGAVRPVESPSQQLGEQLSRKMQDGEEFMLFTGGKESPITLYWTQYGGPMGEIVWTLPGKDPNTVSERHRLPMHTVTDVFVGFPCPHAKSVANADVCLSLKGKTNSMDLVATSGASLEAWLNGIKYILMSRGKKVVQNDPQAAAAAPSAEGKAAGPPPPPTKGKRFSVVGQSASAGPEPGAAPPPPSQGPQFQGEANTPQLKMMMSGCDMYAYDGDVSSPVVTPVHVFFSRKGGKFGSIYWCERGARREDPSKCLLMHELTDIYVGKQQPIFKHPIAKDIEDQKCFSVIAKKNVLHVQAESVQVMKDWMVGINYVLTSTGRKVVLENETGEKKATPAGRRFSRHFSVAVRSKTTHKGVLKMAKGALFQRFRQKKSRPDRSVKTQIFVFHSRLVAPEGQVENKNITSGALFWYEKKDAEVEDEGKKTKERSCMPIHSITDVFLGKQAPIFQTKCANLCPEDCALTITGMSISKRGKEESFSLYLEAEHPTVAQEWMEALQYLLKEHGRELLDEPAPSGEQKAGEKTTGRRLSVVKPAAATGPKSDDPFDMLGVDGANDLVFDENTAFVPASRPENPFGTDSANDEWNPFGDASGDVFGAAPAGTAADPFAGAGFDTFGDNPFGTAAPPGLDATLGKYLADQGLMDLAPKFVAEKVDFATLQLMQKQDLLDIKIPMGPAIKIASTIKTWKPSS